MTQTANREDVRFRGKAETLESLMPFVTTARVLGMVLFHVNDWLENPTKVFARISAAPWANADTPLIVRSAAAIEDRPNNSLAGHFVSIGNVTFDKLSEAIDQVAKSFGDSCSPDDQVFVQPMLFPQVSGVAFTRDPNTAAPYLVINYEETGDTTAVTSGAAADLKTLVYWKGGACPCPEPFDKVAALAAELESLLGVDSLDIEFALLDDQLYLFQVRPLTICDDEPVSLESHRKLLENIAEKIDQANRPHAYLCGRRTLYGVMPDWNPAEMIGIRPRTLALSLYRELITDNVWAYQRHNYGYRNLRSFPLMLSFHGLPYIDVRVSFNSFIPEDLSNRLADRLVDCYTDQLAAAPILHDKVEFEIVVSCYTFDLEKKLERLKGSGFSDSDLGELADSLRRVTNRIINRKTGLWRTDSDKIEKLAERQLIVRSADMDLVSRIYWLIEDCKRYGTLPFAGLARAGFIAVQMLKSLVAVGALEARQADKFMAGLETVSGNMSRDLKRLSRAQFLEKYGHLRPGTYDIRLPRYDECPERYFSESVSESRDDDVTPPPDFALSLSQMRGIDDLLRKHELDMDVVSLFEFLQAGIQKREHAKFIFTRSLSDALSLLTEYGARYGLSREDMSFFDASLIKDLYTSSGDAETLLHNSISQGRARYAETQRIVLPSLISQPEEVWKFHTQPTEPNFITQGTAEGSVCGHDAPPGSLDRAIVFISSADPGFDWIFSHDIAGFVTAYGGVNSHMAIRAGELNLPAVIGAGEKLYDRWRGANRLYLDCATKRVEILA